MKLEWNDLRCILTLINAILIIFYDKSIAWFGIFIAFLGIMKDITLDRKINGVVMHFTTLLLNIYFLICKCHKTKEKISLKNLHEKI